MIRRVLLPLDGSELAEAILTPLSPLLVDREAELVLVGVVSDSDRAACEESLDVCQAELQRVADRLSERGQRVEVRAEHGDPAERILAVVDQEQPDLVAMATHGRTGLTRLVRGSVAERVLRSCPVPLLLANPGGLRAEAPPFQRILVPLDGSKEAERILPYVAVLAAALGGPDASITLLRVEPLEPYTQVEFASPLVADSWDPKHTLEALEPARARMEVACAGAPGSVLVRAEVGVPAHEILAAAREADLVAMTTHGRSGLSRWWFGSVAEQVLRHCEAPLLVVRTT